MFMASSESKAGSLALEAQAFWEGKEVWVVLDAKEGLWRQASVRCLVPPAENRPKDPWMFVLDTHHDSYRHSVALLPKDPETCREFEFLKLSDAAVLTARDNVFKGWQSPAWFDIVGQDAPTYQVKGGGVAVHPYVSEEITELRKRYKTLEKRVGELELALEIKTQEFAEKCVELLQVELAFKEEREQWRIRFEEVMYRFLAKEKECVELTAEKAALVLQNDELRQLLNQLQSENNTLRARLQIMMEDILRVKQQLAMIEHELDEKNRQNTNLKKENADLSELLQLAYDKNLALEDQLRDLRIEHEQCGVVRRGLEDEIERLKRRVPVPPPPPAPIVVPAEFDDSALRTLLQQFESQYENVWLVLYSTLLELADRVARLESKKEIPIVPPKPIEPPVTFRGDEGLQEGRRLASSLGGEIDTLKTRIEVLENWVDAPYSEPEPVVITKPLARSPDLDTELLRQLISLVKFLSVRQEELIKKVDSKQPKYVPTYRQLVPSLAKGSQYDGDFPWLLTGKIAKLEEDNQKLRSANEIIRSRHYELINRTDAAVSPILSENAELRVKVTEYRDDLLTTYRRLSDAEDTIKKLQAGVLGSALEGLATVASGLQ